MSITIPFIEYISSTMSDSNQSKAMFVIGTDGLSTTGPRVSIHLNDLIKLLQQREESAVAKYIKMV